MGCDDKAKGNLASDYIIMPNPNLKKERFSIPSFREEISTKKEQEKRFEQDRVLKAKLLKEARRLEKQQKLKEQQVIFNVYGRQMLEAAAKGCSATEICDISEAFIDLCDILSQRGFYVYVSETKEFAELNQSYQDLFLKYNPSSKEDDLLIYEYVVSWGGYPVERKDGLNDCLNAVFLDWLSDDFGSGFVADIFRKIEEIDYEGGKKIDIGFKEIKINNEYTHDEPRQGLRIFKTDFPFEMAQILSFFSLMGYTVNSKETNLGGIISINWY